MSTMDYPKEDVHWSSEFPRDSKRRLAASHGLSGLKHHAVSHQSVGRFIKFWPA